MKQEIATTPEDSQPPRRNSRLDELVYRSDDGLVEVWIKRSGALRYPQHNYPVVCLRLRGARGTRVQPFDGGLDVLLRHSEVAHHVRAIATADPKCAGYVVPDIPEKSPARKRYWDGVNAERWAAKRKGK